MPAGRSLKILLQLIALHSLLTGVFLIIGSPDWFLFFGFPYHGGFFSVQGGVFHLVMVVAYLIAAKHFKDQGMIVWFCIAAKYMAATFLTIYFILMEEIWVVLVSGILDFIMGLLVMQFYSWYKKSIHA